MPIRWLIPVVVVLSVFLPAGVSAKAPGPMPRDVALRVSDVPQGFKETESIVVTNSVAAHNDGLSLSAISRLGRITGYSVTFSRTTSRGACCINNDVTLFRTDAQATRAHKLFVNLDRQRYASYPGYRQAYADGGKVFVFSFPCQCGSSVHIVDFIRTYVRNFTFTVQIHYVPGTTDPRQVLSLATHYTNLVARRIRLGADNPTDNYLRNFGGGQYDAFAKLSRRFARSTDFHATYRAYTKAIVHQLNTDYSTILQRQRAEAVFVGDVSRSPMPFFSTLNPTVGPFEATPDPQAVYLEVRRSGSAFGSESVNGVRYRTYYAALPVPPVLHAHHVVAGLIVYRRV